MDELLEQSLCAGWIAGPVSLDRSLSWGILRSPDEVLSSIAIIQSWLQAETDPRHITRLSARAYLLQAYADAVGLIVERLS